MFCLYLHDECRSAVYRRSDQCPGPEHSAVWQEVLHDPQAGVGQSRRQSCLLCQTVRRETWCESISIINCLSEHWFWERLFDLISYHLSTLHTVPEHHDRGYRLQDILSIVFKRSLQFRFEYYWPLVYWEHLTTFDCPSPLLFRYRIWHREHEHHSQRRQPWREHDGAGTQKLRNEIGNRHNRSYLDGLRFFHGPAVLMSCTELILNGHSQRISQMTAIFRRPALGLAL